jgi:hypothetical protein
MAEPSSSRDHRPMAMLLLGPLVRLRRKRREIAHNSINIFGAQPLSDGCHYGGAVSGGAKSRLPESQSYARQAQELGGLMAEAMPSSKPKG